MSISEQEQDITRHDSVKQKPDTSLQKQVSQADTIRIRDSLPLKKKEIRQITGKPADTDTLSVSVRSHISDVTLYDSANIITRINRDQINGFPFRFIEKNRERENKSNAFLMKSLREGEKVAERPFHDDWIIFLILIAAFFYASLPLYSRKLFPGATRFFLFRGVGGPEARETSELFHWQSTIFNLITFFNLALFIYFIAVYYALIPGNLAGFTVWAIALGIVIVSITLRHLACMITGWLSGQQEAMDEYTITIYQAYRYQAFACFILVILLSYTRIFPPKMLFLTGYLSFAALYFMRIARLLLIFLKRNVSLLYLILYLCALEILPVAVIIKYVTGLF
jgi:hypothetical protein